MPKKPTTRGRAVMATIDAERPRCGLCGKTENLTRTDCCGNWICDDEANYRLFSYARNSCHRNHSRYTLCGFHHGERHPGDWKTCEKCRESFVPEMYAWYGTNEYNFERLANPPAYEPTKCASCGRVIRLAADGYAIQPGGNYVCLRCSGYPGGALSSKTRRGKR